MIQMKKFTIPVFNTIVGYLLLFHFFDETILGLCFAFIQMFMVPVCLMWIFVRFTKHGRYKYSTRGYYLATIQISLVITDLILMVCNHSFVPKGPVLFLLVNLLFALLVLSSLIRNQEPVLKPFDKQEIGDGGNE